MFKTNVLLSILIVFGSLWPIIAFSPRPSVRVNTLTLNAKKSDRDGFPKIDKYSKSRRSKFGLSDDEDEYDLDKVFDFYLSLFIPLIV